MEQETLTRSILSCAFTVSRELGAGFVESVYLNALALVLAQNGHRVELQKTFQVFFRNVVVGNFRADLVVDESIVVELKVAKALVPEHQAQVINYLKATRIEIGLLINFGNPRLEFRRLTRSIAQNS